MATDFSKFNGDCGIKTKTRLGRREERVLAEYEKIAGEPVIGRANRVRSRIIADVLRPAM